MAGASDWYSPWDTYLDSSERSDLLWKVELRDLARGFCAALFVGLPLLYTAEMWQRSHVVPAWDLLLILAGTYLVNVGYHQFGDFKADGDRASPWFDAVTCMVLGLLASAVTLLLIGRYTLATPPELVLNLLLLESVPASFGASLAINQLGKRHAADDGGEEDGGGDAEDAGDREPGDGLPADAKKVLGAALGGLLFAFNIAPTVEPQLITFSLTWWHVLAILAFSLLVSWLMVFFARFVERDGRRGRLLRSRFNETVVSYLVALGVSAVLLWMFGYVTLATPPEVMIPWIVVMGYATSLGGAAGRLVL